MPFLTEMGLQEVKDKKRELERKRKIYILNKEKNNYPEWYYESGLRDFNEQIDMLNEFLINYALRCKQEELNEKPKGSQD